MSSASAQMTTPKTFKPPRVQASGPTPPAKVSPFQKLMLQSAQVIIPRRAVVTPRKKFDAPRVVANEPGLMDIPDHLLLSFATVAECGCYKTDGVWCDSCLSIVENPYSATVAADEETPVNAVDEFSDEDPDDLPWQDYGVDDEEDSGEDCHEDGACYARKTQHKVSAEHPSLLHKRKQLVQDTTSSNPKVAKIPKIAARRT